VPRGLAPGHGERPIEKVADVREDLEGSAAILARLEIDVALRGIAEDFPGAVGNGGQGVAKEIARTDSVWHGHSGIR
jgi:hypothetical protein